MLNVMVEAKWKGKGVDECEARGKVQRKGKGMVKVNVGVRVAV